jgi:predicted DNA-binding WGR domain protein
MPRDSINMIAQPYKLYIERRDPGRNMARFYALSIEKTLFGQARLVRRWGRIGSIGRTMQHSFDTERQAVELFLALLRTKRQRGYGTPGAEPTPHSDRPITSRDQAGCVERAQTFGRHAATRAPISTPKLFRMGDVGAAGDPVEDGRNVGSDRRINGDDVEAAEAVGIPTPG